MFILPLIVIVASLELLLRNIPNDYSYKRTYLEKNSNKIETLILGSSHSYRGVNPQYFSSNTFNLAHVSQTLEYDYKLLMKYKDRLDKLETIYLSVSYFTYWSKLADGIEFWRSKNYQIYYDIGGDGAVTDYSELFSNKLKTSTQRIVNFIKNRKSEINCNFYGCGLRSKPIDYLSLNKSGILAAKRHTIDNIDTKKYREIFKDNISIVSEILSWSKQRNIKVILFTPPAHESYRINLKFEQLEATIKSSIKFELEYVNCSYYNFIDDESFEVKDFYDADHLSEIGAKKLSVKLNSLN